VAAGTTELLGSVPTRSIVAQEAVANGVLAALVAAVGMTPGEFKAHHPGGAIGAAAGVAAAA
jgi:D-arabinose 5-phosphate isomerase GutQ